MTKIYDVEVGKFYIKAHGKGEVIDIMWEKFGVEYSQIRKISISDEKEYSDN